MEGNDQRRAIAENYIGNAIKILQAARSKHLDHTDAITVKVALAGLGIVQRSIAGAAVPDAKIAARLRQVAGEVKRCGQPHASIGHADVETAARIFQAIADGL